MRTERAGGALADDQVELEVLHGGVEDFLDGRLQAVDFVDEQHVPGLEVGEDRGEVAGALDDRAGGGAEADAEFAGDDLGERGLAEAGRAVQQDMVQRFAAGAGGLDEDGEVFAGGALADEFRKRLRPERGFGGVFVAAGRGRWCGSRSHGGFLVGEIQGGWSLGQIGDGVGGRVPPGGADGQEAIFARAEVYIRAIFRGLKCTSGRFGAPGDVHLGVLGRAEVYIRAVWGAWRCTSERFGV